MIILWSRPGPNQAQGGSDLIAAWSPALGPPSPVLAEASPIDLVLSLPNPIAEAIASPITDAIELLLSLPGPIATIDGSTIVAEYIPVLIRMGVDVVASSLTFFSPPCVGVVQGRAGEADIAEDRALLLSKGCIVVGEEQMAGATWFWVYMPMSVLHNFLDVNFNKLLPGVYTRVPEGTVPLLSSIKLAFFNSIHIKM